MTSLSSSRREPSCCHEPSYRDSFHNCTNIAICRQFAWQMVSSQCLTLGSSLFIIIKTLYFNIKRLLLCLPT
ncbi:MULTISPECIES: hypothetical protein [unclassified Wolbachia]|uniref:hypothetical protein n=1 Tax=unclassified Wolbachia TaxID=2640676 RepID=UPI002230652D|nr:hypothetical protein [Wolbachia endosymbiont (group A) of Apoderus coryli]